VAAALLGVSRFDLDRTIRGDAALQAFIASIERVNVDPAYEQLSVEQYSRRVQASLQAYTVDALDQMHRLAMIDAPSAAWGKVKLDACIALRAGAEVQGGAGDELSLILRELDRDYRLSAPRIKEIRQTVIALTGSSASSSDDPSAASSLRAQLPALCE